MKKLTLDENFTPLPIAEGDEIFVNGIFQFNITKLTKYIHDNPNKFSIDKTEVNRLTKYNGSNLDKATIQSANLSNPIILAEISPGRYNIIDGHHRLEKARRDGIETIHAYKVKNYQLLKFLTSIKTYKLYIEYWNSKLDDNFNS